MEITFIYLLWFTTLVFAICSFIWRRQMFFPVLTAVYFLSTAFSMVQIDYVGFGSTSVITYNHEMGDWYGDEELFYLLSYTGFIFFIFALWNGLAMSKHDIEAAERGEPVIEDTRDWR